MSRKTPKPFEQQVSKKEYNAKIIDTLAKLPVGQARIFGKISEKVWFKQYAKQSEAQLNEIVKKVKKGIKQGKYTYAAKAKDDLRGIIGKAKKKPAEKKKKPAKKKGRKPSTKKGVKMQEPKVTKGKKVTFPKEPKKMRVARLQKQIMAPSGRTYSETELWEGLGSKRAAKYRASHNIPSSDWATIENSPRRT